MAKRNAYERITDWMLEEIDRGVVPWRRPWRLALGSDGQSGPFNLKGKAYRGINRIILGMAPYESPYWDTFNGARSAGGAVKRGERGWPVAFFQWYDRRDTKSWELERLPVLRSFTVFNAAEQCEGLDVPESTIVELAEFETLDACEAIASGYADGPVVEHQGDRAAYAREADRVRMPPQWQFAKPAGYYETLFHELGHSTGHASRLNRKFGSRFSHGDYSREELVAELCAAFLCHESGIGRETRENNAAYLDGWRRALKSDARCIVTAASQAQKAADWILGRRATTECGGEE